MTATAGSRAGRNQTSGDIIRDRVESLVAEHNATVAAIEAAIADFALRRTRRTCPECGGNMVAAIDQDCQTCALADDSGPTPDGAAKGAAAPTRPVAPSLGDGSGTPDDWPDQRPPWMDPNHELTHYDALGIAETALEYPGMCSGTFTYASLNTWGNR